MKVLVWATTFGADLWSFTRHLDAHDDVDVRVVMEDPDGFLGQPVAGLFPLRCPLIRRRAYHGRVGLVGFRPDLTVTGAIGDPTCCAGTTRAFLDEHMLGADGHAAERAFDVARELTNPG